MKKIVSLIGILAVVASLLTTCGKFTCDGCGEEKTGSKKTLEAYGQKLTLCNECYGTIKSLGF